MKLNQDDFSNEDFRRIVACLKACEGISTEELEEHGLRHVIRDAVIEATEWPSLKDA